MRIFLIVVSAILLVTLIVLQQSLGIAPSEVFDTIRRWPVEQQLTLFVVAAVILVLLAAGIWQADKMAQQARAIDILQKRMNGLRDEVSGTDERQSAADAAVRHLVDTDPVAIIDDVQKRLAEAEARTFQQSAQNDAVDLQSRIDEIRRRQQSLRTQLGTTSEKRRVIEPMLGEVKERQALIERSLGELEKDGNGKSLDSRIQETEGFLNRGHTRLDDLETMFGNLEQLRDRMQQLQDEIAPLRSPETGIKALYENVVGLQKNVDAALLSLEKDETDTIGERLDRVFKKKNEIEQRIAALTESFGSLEAVRQAVGDQFQKLNAALEGHLRR